MALNKASLTDRIIVVISGGFLLYVLTAPPIMMAVGWRRGSLREMPMYQPLLDLITSDFGGPLLWYFNDVWGAGIILIGNESRPPLLVILAYTVAGVIVLGALLFPFLRRKRMS